MIQVNELSKSFGDVHAVKKINFTIDAGQVVGLLGPNGAGKTTTMRMLTGYLPIDHGSVQICEHDIAKDPMAARAHIGYLPENAPLYQDMEVSDYLRYIANLRDIPVPKQRANIAHVVDTCGLSKVIGRPIHQLSKGFRQRVGLAAAMVHQPRILILDEPTTGLDPNQIGDIRDLIRHIGKERTVILSTHIMQEVEAVCSRIMIINDGQLVSQGNMSDILISNQAHSEYTISIRALRPNILTALERLESCVLGEWKSDETSDVQQLTVMGQNKDMQAEQIFKWAVQEEFVLSELTQSSMSLEDVFRNVTQQ